MVLKKQLQILIGLIKNQVRLQYLNIYILSIANIYTTENAILLSKHVSSEFFTRLYQEAPKQTATGESSAIVWAKRVCNLLLADKTVCT